VSKAFTLRYNAARDLKVRLIGLVDRQHRERRERLWALRNVDLDVTPGECLGLIGPNGAGKSTLLRIMAGIFPPTTGEVCVRGRVAPMIEVGVGFHPELTGRENLHLTASLYGLSTRATDRLVPQIVDFSELEGFLDVPVKNYSRGMHARLGFSIAVHLDPEVLLIDEVLAVGDERFQAKCLSRIEGLRRRGTTVVLVSHHMPMVMSMCDRACLLLHGRIVATGEPAAVIERYRKGAAAPGPQGPGRAHAQGEH
jgi:ABC-type polysaccharide/polyol phosphate transport system ATPase subunit